MKQKRQKPKSKILEVVRTPMFKMRVEKNKKKYDRKKKEKFDYDLRVLDRIFRS